MANLPKTQRAAIESAEVVNQYLDDYLDELFLSDKSFFNKFPKVVRANWEKQRNIIAVSQVVAHQNFELLEKRSKGFDAAVNDLTVKIASLKKENVGKEYPTEFGGLFASLAKKAVEWGKDFTEFNTLMKVVGHNGYKMPMADLPKNDDKTPKSPDETKKEKEESETNKNANKFYKRFLEWMGMEKAKGAIAKTRDDAKETKAKIERGFTKTGQFIKSAFDNILDLPMVISGMVGGFVSKLTGLLASGISFALVGAGKLIRTRFGAIGILMSIMMSDGAQELIKTGMTTLFGEENTKKIVNFFKKYDFESILTGAGIGAMIAGPIGAIIGGIIGKLVADMNKLSIPEIENKIKEVSESREKLQTTLSDTVNKINGLNQDIEKAVADNNTSLVTYLEGQKKIVESDRERIRLQLKEQENALIKLNDHKQTIEEFGWFGKLAVTLDNWSKSFNDLWVSYLTPFKSADELKATYDLKIEDTQKWFGEKWKVFTDWVDYIIDLPSKLLDKMNNFLEEKRNWLYEKTNGWLGTPSQEEQKKIDQAGKAGSALGDSIKSLAPGAGVMAPNNDKTDYIKYLEKQREAINEVAKQRANALINAPTNNTQQTVVQNNSSSTVSMRASPIDAMLRNSPVIAW